jgi:hypothetical protein
MAKKERVLAMTINRGLPPKRVSTKFVITLSNCVSRMKAKKADSIARHHITLTLGFYSIIYDGKIKLLTKQWGNLAKAWLIWFFRGRIELWHHYGNPLEIEYGQTLGAGYKTILLLGFLPPLCQRGWL